MSIGFCQCVPKTSATCSWPEHNEKVLLVRCDQCNRESHADRKRCRFCGCVYGTFARVDGTLAGKIRASRRSR